MPSGLLTLGISKVHILSKPSGPKSVSQIPMISLTKTHFIKNNRLVACRLLDSSWNPLWSAKSTGLDDLLWGPPSATRGCNESGIWRTTNDFGKRTFLHCLRCCLFVQGVVWPQPFNSKVDWCSWFVNHLFRLANSNLICQQHPTGYFSIVLLMNYNP